MANVRSQVAWRIGPECPHLLWSRVLRTAAVARVQFHSVAIVRAADVDCGVVAFVFALLALVNVLVERGALRRLCLRGCAGRLAPRLRLPDLRLDVCTLSAAIVE